MEGDAARGADQMLPPADPARLSNIDHRRSRKVTDYRKHLGRLRSDRACKASDWTPLCNEVRHGATDPSIID